MKNRDEYIIYAYGVCKDGQCWVNYRRVSAAEYDLKGFVFNESFKSITYGFKDVPNFDHIRIQVFKCIDEVDPYEPC